MLLASSLNHWSAKDIPGASVCQKPFSGYIELIAEWRTELFRKPPQTVVRLFPFGEVIVDPVATSTDSDNVVERDGEGAMIEVEEDLGEGKGGVEGGGAGEADNNAARARRRLVDGSRGDATETLDGRLSSQREVLSSAPATGTGNAGHLEDVRSPSRR